MAGHYTAFSYQRLVSQLYWRYTCKLEYLANRAGGLDASRLVLVCNINQELRTAKRTGTGAGRRALNRIADTTLAISARRLANEI